jgi:signal peptidase II
MISLLAPYGRGFAIFNVADSCLTVGVVLAVLLELTGRQRDGSRTRPAATERAA